jgi:hypothetical protein
VPSVSLNLDHRPNGAGAVAGELHAPGRTALRRWPAGRRSGYITFEVGSASVASTGPLDPSPRKSSTRLAAWSGGRTCARRLAGITSDAGPPPVAFQGIPVEGINCSARRPFSMGLLDGASP